MGEGARATALLVEMEFDDFAGDATVANAKSPDTDGKFEAARSGAGRIEIEDAVSDFIHGRVGVAGDDGGESGGCGIQVELFQIVEHVQRESAGFNYFVQRKSLAPGTGIDVSANRLHGCNVTEFVRGFQVSPRLRRAG